MQILVRGDSTRAIEVSPEDSAFAIKLILQNQGLGAADEQVIIHNGEPLEDEEIIENRLSNGDTIDFYQRLHGGKVHGSLARAGKVKGQTPKVDKQEKKKKATGRAKRRLQYNRRFVNAVRTPGRRRGPNANVPA